MIRSLKSHELSLLIIPTFLFVLLVFTYGSIVKTIPFSFWDEFLWVGRSYFFDFYIQGDFKNRIWQSLDSYDQPQLTNYAYGAWLYPLYLSEKGETETPFDYTRFLIKNGLYQIDERYMDAYADYRNSFHVMNFNGRDTGFPLDYVAKYGVDSLRTINLIYDARILNVFLLAGATLFAYYFAVQYAGVITATVFSLFLGFNSLIIDTGLKAHSEALFLFTFNAAFLFMVLYFIKGRRLLYLLLFSLFAGLCMSTKLNGSMWVFIFFITNILLALISKEKKIAYFLHGAVPAMISLVMFVALNPFTFPDPVNNLKYMFDHRMKVASEYQAKAFPEEFLPDGISRVKRVFWNFYSPETGSDFNGVKVFDGATPSMNYESFLIVPFIVGLLYSAKLSFDRNTIAIIFVCAFIIVMGLMGYYLILDWARYYAHLPLFFVAFQSLGLCLVVKHAFRHLILNTLDGDNDEGGSSQQVGDG